MAYGKIFESLYTGSMVGSGINVFALWAYVIASAKPPGTIELNPKILATVFGCTIDEVRDAIEKLCQPDPESRTKDFEGRRLIPEGQFLYAVPTWEKYNSLRNEIERREQNREAAQRYRSRQRRHADEDDASSTSAQSAHTVCVSSSSCTSLCTSEKNAPVRTKAVDRPEGVDEQTWADWLAHRRGVKAPLTQTAMNGIVREAAKAGVGLQEALQEAMSRGWRSWKAEWRSSTGGAPGRSSKGVVPKDLSKEDWGESGPI